MAEAAPEPDVPAPKSLKRPLILGLVLALCLGGGGFYATWSGLILGGDHAPAAEVGNAAELPDVAFVPLDPLLITLGTGEAQRHLRFAAQIEVAAPHAAEVAHLLPRLLDVMNGYLRAVDPSVLEDPAGLVRIRAHLLRRIQLVTGEGWARDLLVTEFVLN